MGALEKFDYTTPEAYLLAENDHESGVKYEFSNGLVYAMAGASRNHNQVAMNFAGLLFMQLRGGKCRVSQSDMKVGINFNNESHFYYPDVQVSCEDEDNKYYNTSPCLIVEVLSESTARIDRNEKLTAYRQLPSLQEYVLCSQDFPAIEIYRRSTNWTVERFTAGQTVTLESVGYELVLDELYDFLLPLAQFSQE